ncbi:FkbM family methyltransferase [Paraflavitalea speifideaquila]|uniref:FkbM family methyltransferase n=1 Tax=Paraflavitalea speifideaquila TaxID=3076558 RepID=UPI0028E86F82|nr:FkbM family methyltransferase [Paraflavitalea speifideiaquila]
MVKNLSGLPDIYCLNNAIWHSNKSLGIFDTGGGEYSYLVKEESEDEKAVTRSITINDIIEKYQLLKIDLLKIDIEGSEKELFSGNYNSWLSKVGAIVIEVHDWFRPGCAAAFSEPSAAESIPCPLKVKTSPLFSTTTKRNPIPTNKSKPITNPFQPLASTTTFLPENKLPGWSKPPVQPLPTLKVLFVIDTLQVGGAEQSLLDITPGLKKVKPVICHLYAGEALKPQFINSGLPVHSVGLQQKYGFISAYRALKRIVHKEQPDLIVACLTRSELVARVVAHVSNVPVIGTFVSDLYGKAYNQSLSIKAKIAVSFFRLLNRITASYCKGFIANSEAIKTLNAIQLRLPPEKN